MGNDLLSRRSVISGLAAMPAVMVPSATVVPAAAEAELLISPELVGLMLQWHWQHKCLQQARRRHAPGHEVIGKAKAREGMAFNRMLDAIVAEFDGMVA